MNRIITYIGADGFLHLLVNLVIVAVMGAFLPLWTGVVAASALSLAKEFIWDLWMKKGVFSIKDIACDAVGIVSGIGIYACYIG